MKLLETSNNSLTFSQHSTPKQPVNTRHQLVIEIGRLRVQLHQAQNLQNADQRSAFLRDEIQALKRQLEGIQ